jgi:hypothetical protein
MPDGHNSGVCCDLSRMTIRSPSPQPSPLGRGRNLRRLGSDWSSRRSVRRRVPPSKRCIDACASEKVVTADVDSLSPSRNDAIEVWVERATGPSCRATSPTVERTAHSRNGERSRCARLGGRLPPRTAKLAVPPRPTASLRPRERAGVRGKRLHVNPGDTTTQAATKTLTRAQKFRGSRH